MICCPETAGADVLLQQQIGSGRQAPFYPVSQALCGIEPRGVMRFARTTEIRPDAVNRPHGANEKHPMRPFAKGYNLNQSIFR